MSELFVSIVIPTFNREKVLCDTIQALFLQEYSEFEIIVVDQTSKHLPTTQEYLDKLHNQGLIKWFHIAPPSLPSARNYGVRQARGEIILFLDDDIVPDKHLIKAHVIEHNSRIVGAVAGRHTRPDATSRHEKPEIVGRIRRNTDPISNFYSEERREDLEWAPGGHTSISRELISRVGFFEERFIQPAVYEDIDFYFRLKKLGYKIIFTPNSFFIHLAEKDGGCEVRNQNKSYWYGLFHNSLLFTYRNIPIAGWLFVIWDRLLMSLALTRQHKSPAYIALFIAAFFRSAISFFQSIKSLRGKVI